MSTSLLYHAFGLRGYRHVNCSFEGGRVTFCVRQARDQLCCADCGSDQVYSQGSVPRTFRTIPIGAKPVHIQFAVPRVFCFACQNTRQVKLQFADPRKSYTRAFERYALDLSRHMTIKAVAKHLQVSWDTIKQIQATSLQRRFGAPKLGKLKQIAIDEIAIGKGHSYFTVVLDLLSGAVVFVGDGKGVEALEPFWKRLRASRAKIKAVATDMGKAYIKAVRDNLPHVVHVFDHFHVVKLFNDKLSALRRELYNQAQSDSDRKLLKGTRWLLLKNPENLDAKRNEEQRLQDALKLNEPLSIAYYLKEDLRQIWSQANKRTARRVLRDWMKRARVSGIRMLKQFAGTLEEHEEGILAYYDYPISTGPLEGTNTKIRAMQRQAYGFRDRDFYKLKILGIHESQYALVG
jgi:transposase